MAKPRIFISSTCFDLNDVRSELTQFLESYNFEVLNSQLKNFGVTPRKHSHSACLDQVKNSDYLILVIGTRRGRTFIGSELSITNEEYNLALKKGIPTITFVNRRVEEAIPLYKKNPRGDFSTVVDNKKIFNFIELIESNAEDNWLHPFSNIIDIKDTLRAQFSYYLLLFSQGLRKKGEDEKKEESSKLVYVKYPSNVRKIKKKKLNQDEEIGLKNGLKELHKVMTSILASHGRNSNKLEKLKTMWVFARYGKLNYDARYIAIDSNIFADYAWGSFKGDRIFKQMEPFGIGVDFDDEERALSLSFRDQQIPFALMEFVHDLYAQYGEEGYKLFKKADMRLYVD